jgi:hypothetical protein
MKTSDTVRHNLLETLAIHRKPQNLTSLPFEMYTGRGGGGGGGPVFSPRVRWTLTIRSRPVHMAWDREA